MNNIAKINRIKELFNQLYCFKSEEINQYLSRLEKIPPRGIDELLKTLEEGKVRQDELLAEAHKRDKEFNKELKSHLKKETAKIKKSYEAGEKNRAEDILEQL